MQLVEIAVEVDRSFAVPQQPNDFERLLVAADGLGEIEPVGHGVLGLAAAEAEDETAVGQMVDGERALRQQGRMPTYRVDNTRRQWHVLRQHCRRSRDGHAVQVESGQKLTM